MTADQAASISPQPRAAGWSVPRAEILGYLLVALQCAAVLILVHRFRLENELFQQVVTIAMAGFLVHHWLPARLQMPFFVVLSLGSVAYFFGLEQRQWVPLTSLQRTGTLLGVGGAFIALCHVPVRYGLRVTLLIAAACGLAVFRAGWIHLGPLDAIWPVLGAMFMFRLLIYAYDIEHDEDRPTLWQTLAYFFLFPAVWLFVFPVIDLRTFRSTYFNDKPLTIYNKGVQWMFRGIVQLLLWRLVYYHFYLDPSRVLNGTDLMQYLVSNVALYLRVSGQFHFVIGVLHLFGFHLPETHRRYVLASSFTDYWRRINIYWKDFITRLVYYPLVLRLKTWTPTSKVLLATACAFVATWFLHAYQWFWLRGTFPLEPKDVVFWGAFGLVVSLNSIRELSRGRKRSLSRPVATWRDNVKLGLRTAGTFLVLLVLWSIWSCDTVGQWIDIWKLADASTVLWSLLLLLVIASAAILIEGPATPWAARGQANQTAELGPFPWRHAFVTCLLPAAFLYAGSSGHIYKRLPLDQQTFIVSLSRTAPNKTDEEYMVRGYYENLMDGTRFNNLLNSAFNTKPANWLMLDETTAARNVPDMRVQELIPSKSTFINGKTIEVNRWGMRDRDYDLVKAPGTCRIAVIGTSHEMGYGVENSEIFDPLLEERLNREHAGKSWQRYEILNFAVNAYSPLSQVEVMHKKVSPFRPDVLFFFPHEEQIGIMTRLLAQTIRKGIEPEYDFIRQVIRESGVTATTAYAQAERRLTPYWPRLTEWAYRDIVAECRRNNIHPVWIYIPGVAHERTTKEEQILIRLAQESGFQVLSLPYLYTGHDPNKLVVAPWDAHPNAIGHRMIADGLYPKIFEVEVLKLKSPTAVAQTGP